MPGNIWSAEGIQSSDLVLTAVAHSLAGGDGH